jgi:hypothetical protein
VTANIERGEMMLGAWKLRPTYAALVAAEAEIGSLFALLERTSASQVTLADMICLLWHCAETDMTRDTFAESCVTLGIAQLTPAYRQLIETALAGA